ncbi:MAG: LysR family transcriptional regulator [Bacteroidetes bacterium]|nr:LysR family transcriptional regulator [Bacteroidota bacterium]
MNYTLHQLSVFLKVTQTKSITKAAEELNLTQPAVSIQLKNFLDQFDIPLIDVIKKRIYITDFGLEIARMAENILIEVKSIDQKTQQFKGKLSGKLKISAASTGKYVMPYFITHFLRKHNEVELLLDVTNKSMVIESLERNEIDFALVSVLPENMKLKKIELMENKLFLVGNLQSNLGIESNHPKVIENIPLIFRENGSATRSVMEGFLNQHQLKIHKKMELTSNEAVKQAAIAGLGCSIMPIIGIKNELISGQLQIIPVKGLPISSKWYLVWLEEKKLNPVASAYVDFLQTEKNDTMIEYFSWIEKY